MNSLNIQRYNYYFWIYGNLNIVEYIFKFLIFKMKLILGTAQFGLKYGITNSDNKPDNKKTQQMLKTAYENGITIYDTARAYGDSEYKLGLFNKNYKNVTIITKLKIDNDTKDDVLLSVDKSLEMLNVDILDVLLLHRFEYLSNKIILNTILELKEKKKIKKIGISVYTVEEAIVSLKNKDIEYLQIPVNVLDQRWNNNEFLSLVNKRKDVFIFVRSIFLQGIILNNIDKWPKLQIDYKAIINKIDNIVKILNMSKIELCISYCKSLYWINGIIIGIDNEEQLIDNVKLFNTTRKLKDYELNMIKDTFSNIDSILLDPSKW